MFSIITAQVSARGLPITLDMPLATNTEFACVVRMKAAANSFGRGGMSDVYCASPDA